MFFCQREKISRQHYITWSAAWLTWQHRQSGGIGYFPVCGRISIFYRLRHTLFDGPSRPRLAKYFPHQGDLPLVDTYPAVYFPDREIPSSRPKVRGRKAYELQLLCQQPGRLATPSCRDRTVPPLKTCKIKVSRTAWQRRLQIEKIEDLSSVEGIYWCVLTFSFSSVIKRLFYSPYKEKISIFLSNLDSFKHVFFELGESTAGLLFLETHTNN